MGVDLYRYNKSQDSLDPFDRSKPRVVFTAAPVLPSPVAAFSWEPQEPLVGEAVTFDGSGSQNASNWYWEEVTPPGGWGFGQEINSETYEFTFQSSGTKNVQLTVTNANDSDPDSIVHQVVISSPTSPPEEPVDPPPGELSHGLELTRSMTGLEGAGVSSGQLTFQGRTTTSSNGQVLEFRDFDSSGFGENPLTIAHNNVTVRYCRINHRDGANGIVVNSSVTGTRIEYCDFEGHFRTQSGNYGSIGIVGNGAFTAFRCHFNGGRDGVHVYRDATFVVENWFHTLHRNPEAHTDSVYLGGTPGTGPVIVERNRALAGNSGAIDAYAIRNPHRGLTMRNNHIVGEGRGYGLYGGYVFSHRHNNRDIRIEGNRFSGTFRWSNTLGQGTNAAVNLSQPGNTFTNNRWVEGWGDHTVDLPAQLTV